MINTYYNPNGQIINIIKVNLQNYLEAKKYLEDLTSSIKIESSCNPADGKDNLIVKIMNLNDRKVVTKLTGNDDCTIIHRTKGNTFSVARNIPETLQLRPQHHLMRLFAYKHLPPHLQSISKAMCELAIHLDINLPNFSKKAEALKKLSEAKDCAITTLLSK